MSDIPTSPASDESDTLKTVESHGSDQVNPSSQERTIESDTRHEVSEVKPSSEQTLAGIKLEDLPLISGAEPSIERFIEQSFTSPASARVASQSLIETFDDKGLWLASLVKPSHLAAELRQQCSELSSLVIMQWVRQGETHKLKLLGETLLAEPPARRTRETARIMTVLAGLLGILRPVTAQKLVNCAIPYLGDINDGILLHDAKQWVEAGRVLERSPPEERIFWNRHLREPGNDWDWDSAEARLALRHLANIMPREGEILQVFQSAVPGCWWDLWREQGALLNATQSALPAPASASTHTSSKAGRFGLGLILGVAASVAFGWFAFSYLPEPDREPAITSRPALPPVQSGSIEPAEEIQAVEAPPIRESLRQLQSILKRPASIQSSSQSQSPAAIKESPDTSSTTAAPASQSKPELRAQALARHAAAHDDARRLVSLVRTSSYRENAVLIQGQNSVAPKGSPTYQGLIHWLILDPPEHADVRLAVTKLALHSLPVDDTVMLFDLCDYPGSPNEIEIKECANLLLELPETSITEAHRRVLNKIVSAQR